MLTFICKGVIMKRVFTAILLIGLAIYGAGCDSDAKTGALIGGAAGAGVGQAAGGDTKSTVIGGAIGTAGGYLLGRHSDKKKESDSSSQETTNTETVWITNSNGSQTPVEITRSGDKWIGPKGETYDERPTEEQLKKVYGF
jgi:uncharacterized protein YcfJ